MLFSRIRFSPCAAINAYCVPRANGAFVYKRPFSSASILDLIGDLAKETPRTAYVQYKSHKAEFNVTNQSTLSQLLSDSRRYWNIDPDSNAAVLDLSGRILPGATNISHFPGMIQLRIQTEEVEDIDGVLEVGSSLPESLNNNATYKDAMKSLLNIPKLLNTISKMGFAKPTPEQGDMIVEGLISHLQCEHHRLYERLHRHRPPYPQKLMDTLTKVFQGFLMSADSKLDAVYNGMLELANLRKPWLWYPQARGMVRKIIVHTGPTNSGKTHHALERLANAKSGVYCGPLRLLAHEVHERLTSRGVKCSLITGQTKVEVEGSTHISCTVEMANTMAKVDIAVVDEFQMLGDEERGWAWTRALLGVPAKEIHLCGDGSAVEVVQRICAMLGEQVDVHRYNRLSPLACMKKALSKPFGDIRAGDCVVAFTRADIYAIKEKIEAITSHKCCVVYGSLPPSTRSQQAALFNQPDSGYDVLVASDAIGMGLNLNIRRVIFSTVRKFDGTEKRYLKAPEIRQIAGRAGRYGSIYPRGEVTCFAQGDMPILRDGLDAPVEAQSQVGISPSYEQLELFYRAGENTTFSEVLDQFAHLAGLDDAFFLCEYANIRSVAELIEPIPLTLKDRYMFCISPTDSNLYMSLFYLFKYASAYANPSVDKILVGISIALAPPEDGPFTDRERLKQLENIYHVVDLYMWLSHRLDKFTDSEAATRVRDEVHTLITETLHRMSQQEAKDDQYAVDSDVERLSRLLNIPMGRAFNPRMPAFLA